MPLKYDRRIENLPASSDELLPKNFPNAFLAKWDGGDH